MGDLIILETKKRVQSSTIQHRSYPNYLRLTVVKSDPPFSLLRNRLLHGVAKKDGGIFGWCITEYINEVLPVFYTAIYQGSDLDIVSQGF